MLSFKHSLLVGFACAAFHQRIKSGGGRVQFDLTCNNTAVVCSQVKRVIFAAGESLDNVIVITNPITVSVNYYNFCDGNEKCSSGAIGVGSLNKIELGGNHKNYSYPQALVKQMGFERMVDGTIEKYDIYISLNSQHKFQMAGKVNFTSEEYSLASVVAHELLHGLGFLCSFGGLDFEQNLVKPHHEIDDNDQLRFTETIFDSHLYIRETEKPLSSIIDRLNSLPKITKPQNESALLYPPYIEPISELSTLLTTPNSIYFLTNDNSRVYIETGLKQYSPGSTLKHLDQSYFFAKDYTMIQHATRGEGIDSISSYLGWYTAPYGPLTIEVLATLGYTVKKPTWGHSLGGIVQLLRQDKTFAQEIDQLIGLSPETEVKAKDIQ
ncbi:hypothetical protein DSO57_1027809 [Entomophthora muscae]|uniref:Uncharacterized protein n=1 Tax=Entomophthora muscae TaxID=34485 RepID=A0ACC2TCU4_9FUNG|nr:hypothetical protein DSO57_1027809 [Entomophthora muscae]